MWSEEDYRRAKKTEHRAGHIPTVRADTLGAPQPEHGCCDVDAAIGGISPACRRAVHGREEIGEQRQRENAGDELQR